MVKEHATRVLKEAVDGLVDVADYLRFDPVPPFWRELRRYSWAKLKADLIAGVMVAIVTIPQAIGFALVVGLPVQAVLVTAIIGAVVCALFGTSRHLVFGPTNTISIFLVGALATVAHVPLSALQKVLVIGILIAGIQIASGFFKLGNLTHFISRTVIIAYATAVGVLIAMTQVGPLLGLDRSSDVSLPQTLVHIITGLATFDLNPMTAGVGIATFLLLVLLRRLRPSWPEGLIALAIAGGVAVVYDLSSFGVPLVLDVGELSGRVPMYAGFPLNAEGLKLVPQVMSMALAAAILGMLESITIAQNIAARSGQKINPNQELLAVGMGNLASTAFGAMPGSSSFVRSAVCYQSGGATQFASIFGSGVILAIVLLVSGAVNYIPVAALAAYVMFISIRLINPGQIKIVRTATPSDAIVFWVTLAAALFLQLDTAVYVGVGVSLALFLKKASAPALVEYAFNEHGQLTERESSASRGNSAISIVHVEGELFFGAADLFQEQVRILADDDNIRVVILRMKNARHLDATSVMSLLQLHDYLSKTDRHLLISGINPDVEHVLKCSAAWDQLGAENIFPAEANLTMSTKRALLRASHLLQLSVGAKAKPEVRIFYDRKREKSSEADARSDESDHDKPGDYQI